MNTTQFLLNKVSQEASELIKDCTKTAMFGVNSVDPNDPEQKSNLQRIAEEFHDVVAAFELLMDNVGVPYNEAEHFEWSRDFITEKKIKTLKYLNICKGIGSTFENPVEGKKPIHCCPECKSVNCDGSCGCSC